MPATAGSTDPPRIDGHAGGVSEYNTVMTVDPEYAMRVVGAIQGRDVGLVRARPGRNAARLVLLAVAVATVVAAVLLLG